MAPPFGTDEAIKFNGSNWEDLDRLVVLSRFHFLQDDDYNDADRKKCAYLASRFNGPALDWAMSTWNSSATTYDNFEGFITACKEAFGVADGNISALHRQGLDDLRWSHNVPVFFAEFDRLTMQMGITDHGTKIAMVRAKLPSDIKAELARQALDFANYDTMRERLITMWALNPRRQDGAADPLSRPKRSRCGRCGKKGHKADACRSSAPAKKE